MAGFSVTDAALAGFGVVRQRPQALLFWAALQLIVQFVVTVLVVQVAGPGLSQLQALGAGATPTPEQSMQVLRALTPLYLTLIPLMVVVNALMSAAINRAVLRPTESGFGYFQLGADELRQLALLLMLWLLMFALYVASVMIFTVLAGLVATAVAVLIGSTPAVVAPSMVTLALGAVAVVLITVAVRLSLSSAMTFSTRKVDLFGSWALTRGQFWPVFGTYAMTAAIMFGLILLGVIIVFGSTAVVAGLDGFKAMFAPQAGTVSLAAYLSPARIVYLTAYAVVSAVILPIWMTPPAAIYRDLAGLARPKLADVFA